MKLQINPTATRVQINSRPEINYRNKRKAAASIKYYSTAGAEELNQRIDSLEREWDTERVLETNFAGIVTVSALAGYFINKKWSLVAGIAGLFMLQHALQGWCPPLAVIRRAGIRTNEEINEEKSALMAMGKGLS